MVTITKTRDGFYYWFLLVIIFFFLFFGMIPVVSALVLQNFNFRLAQHINKISFIIFLGANIGAEMAG